MSFSRQSHSSSSGNSASMEDSVPGGSPAVAIKQENYSSDLINGQSDYNADEFNYVFKRPCDNASSSEDKLFVPSNMASDGKDLSNYNPTLNLVPLKELQKVTSEVGYCPDNLTVKEEDSSEEMNSIATQDQFNFIKKEMNDGEQENGRMPTSSSNSVPDVKNDSLCDPVVSRLVPLSEDIKKVEKVTNELVYYHPDDLIIKNENKSHAEAERINFLSAENALQNYNCSHLQNIKVKTERNDGEEKNLEEKVEMHVVTDLENDSDNKALSKIVKVEGIDESANDDRIKFKELRVVLEDLFAKNPQDANPKIVHEKRESCLCIFCAGSVKVRRKSPDILEITSIAKPNESFIIREKVLSSVQMQPTCKIESLNINKPEKCACPYCAAKFKLKKDWRKHLRATHPDESPYKCPHCSREFKSPDPFYAHKRTHSNVTKKRAKFSVCPRCPAEFQLKRDWQKHVRTNHPDERPYVCTQCLKKIQKSK